MTAASETKMNSEFLGTNNGSLDVRLVNRFEYESRFRHGFTQEPEILSRTFKDFVIHRDIFGRGKERLLEWEIDICVSKERIDEVICREVGEVGIMVLNETTRSKKDM